MSKRINLADLMSKAKGQWLGIFSSLCPSLQPALAGRPRHVACPVHGGSDGFRFYHDVAETGGGVCNTCGFFASGLSLIAWVNGISWYEALCAVDVYFGGDARLAPAASCPRPAAPLAQEKIAKTDFFTGAKENHLPECLLAQWPGEYVKSFKERYWLNLWNNSMSVHFEDAILTYCESRGLENAPPTLRFQLVPYHDDKNNCRLLPTILARFELSDDVVGLHLIYLRDDFQGKAAVNIPKKMIKLRESLAGSAVRLVTSPDPMCDYLLIGEGIETMLAVEEIVYRDIDGEFDVWACGSAALLQCVKIPSRYRRVLICADHDRSGAGQASAERLAQRLLEEGRTVTFVEPVAPIPEDKKGVDWLDLLVEAKQLKEASKKVFAEFASHS